MVGGATPPHSDSREISRVLVLNLLWRRQRCSRTAQEKCALDNAFALIDAPRVRQPLVKPEQFGGRGAEASHLGLHPPALLQPETRNHRFLVNVDPAAAGMDNFHGAPPTAGQPESATV